MSNDIFWGKAAEYSSSDLSGLTERGRQCLEALKKPHVRACLDAIAIAELGVEAANKGGYGYLFGDMFGKETFNPNNMSTHPRQRRTLGGLTSSATGRYQTMDFVWEEEQPRLGLKDMKPQSQEVMAVSRLMYRQVLDEIIEGNVEAIIHRPGYKGGHFDLNSEWASLEGNPYGQGTAGGKRSTFLANYQKSLELNSQDSPIAVNSADIPRSLQEIFKDKNLKIEYDVVTKVPELAVQVQVRLIALGLLDPPADGKFGPLSTAALINFQKITKCEEGFIDWVTAKKLIETKDLPDAELNLGNDLASRIIRYMKDKGYKVFIGDRNYNIVYLEGAEADGSPNADTFNHWNDRRMVIEIRNDGIPKIVGNWLATTEPGRHYTVNPMNPDGAARVQFGQYAAWQVGWHGTARPHEALVQTGGPISCCRDLNKDGLRTGDRITTGYYGINQHHGWNMPVNDIGQASAGCLVGRSIEEHEEFMRIIKQDKRYQANSKYVFYSTLIDATKI